MGEGIKGDDSDEKLNGVEAEWGEKSLSSMASKEDLGLRLVSFRRRVGRGEVGDPGSGAEVGPLAVSVGVLEGSDIARSKAISFGEVSGGASLAEDGAARSCLSSRSSGSLFENEAG